MATFPVVEHLDVVENVTTSILSVRIGLAADAFPLEALEEAFGDCAS